MRFPVAVVCICPAHQHWPWTSTRSRYVCFCGVHRGGALSNYVGISMIGESQGRPVAPFREVPNRPIVATSRRYLADIMHNETTSSTSYFPNISSSAMQVLESTEFGQHVLNWTFLGFVGCRSGGVNGLIYREDATPHLKTNHCSQQFTGTH